MLRSLSVMFDDPIAASDGVQGTVQDFLFDDESWIVHYMVAETASPLGKKKALILPFAIGELDWERKQVRVQLTSEQIRMSPPLDSDMPVARQRELGRTRVSARSETHLRSVREVVGYSLHTTDGNVGTVEDFIVEDTLWGVQYALVSLKQSPHRSILVPPESIRSISWSAKAAWVNVSLEELEKNPDFDPATC